MPSGLVAAELVHAPGAEARRGRQHRQRQRDRGSGAKPGARRIHRADTVEKSNSVFIAANATSVGGEAQAANGRWAYGRAVTSKTW